MSRYRHPHSFPPFEGDNFARDERFHQRNGGEYPPYRHERPHHAPPPLPQHDLPHPHRQYHENVHHFEGRPSLSHPIRSETHQFYAEKPRHPQVSPDIPQRPREHFIAQDYPLGYHGRPRENIYAHRPPPPPDVPRRPYSPHQDQHRSSSPHRHPIHPCPLPPDPAFRERRHQQNEQFLPPPLSERQRREQHSTDHAVKYRSHYSSPGSSNNSKSSDTSRGAYTASGEESFSLSHNFVSDSVHDKNVHRHHARVSRRQTPDPVLAKSGNRGVTVAQSHHGSWSREGQDQSDHRRTNSRKTNGKPSSAGSQSAKPRNTPNSSSKTRSSKAQKTPEIVDESPIDIDKEIEKLKASYIQCTQHGNMYNRIMHSDSTVEGTPKLKDLYDQFQKQLSNRHKQLWTKNSVSPNTELDVEETPDQLLTMNQCSDVTLELLKSWTASSELTRHQRVKAKMLVKKIINSAAKLNYTLPEYIDKIQPSLPNYCLSKIKELVETGKSDLIASDEAETDGAGELINTIRKLKAHPHRLHEELWYNEPDQANDGPLCHCSAAARNKGIRHNIYPGEAAPASCHQMTNNIGKLHHYRVMVGPATNFMSSKPTSIEHNNQDYMFEGFSIFSHEPLDTIPFCDMIRFHIRYTIYLIKETPPENFCMRGLELFDAYLFREILELYDWELKDKNEPENTETENFRRFRFYPRFVRSLPDNGKEILSLCKVLEYLLESDKPLVAEEDLSHLMSDETCDHEEWRKFTDKVRGMIVMNPGKKPSCLRVDQLDRYRTTPVETQTQLSHAVDDRYPMIVHFGIRPANLSYAGDPTYQRIWRSYLKLRHLMANSPRVKANDKKKLKEREQALQKFRRSKDMQREVTVELSGWGFRRTGIFSDICQHALILPTLTHHLRYHLCLASLEERIGYTFKERKWLSHAMSHPSCHMNFGLNPDHVRNVLSNCGLRVPKYGDSSIHYKYTRKRGITTLIQIMARLGQQRPVLSPIQHNERLEFLGDAVVGYLTSVHLFLMFPDLSEGALTTFRTVLVNNQHLATLAERLRLDEYMLYAHGPDLCRRADLRHAMANCFEALMGAIYMEAGLDQAQELFGKFLWETESLQNVWKYLPLHPLQEEEPDTDRHCIKDIPILQKLTKFEDSIGVKFDHIRLLAKSFTWRNVHENILTHGHNQRLEFLGDSVCNLVASGYLFRLYPTHHEGHLTLLRATIVNGRTQSLVSTDLGMPEYVICNLDNEKGRTPEWKEKNLADLLEAFVAALFLDRGLAYVEAFMKVCFFPRLKEFILKQEWNDPKSCLQQCCLTLRQEGKEPQLPTYEISNQTGPSHARKYVVSVYFQGKEIGKGTAESIQRAERNAARVALTEYNFPQLEWQRWYVAEKHGLPYHKRTNLKKLELQEEKSNPTSALVINGNEAEADETQTNNATKPDIGQDSETGVSGNKSALESTKMLVQDKVQDDVLQMNIGETASVQEKQGSDDEVVKPGVKRTMSDDDKPRKRLNTDT